MSDQPSSLRAYNVFEIRSHILSYLPRSEIVNFAALRKGDLDEYACVMFRSGEAPAEMVKCLKDSGAPKDRFLTYVRRVHTIHSSLTAEKQCAGLRKSSIPLLTPPCVFQDLPNLTCITFPVSEDTSVSAIRKTALQEIHVEIQRWIDLDRVIEDSDLLNGNEQKWLIQTFEPIETHPSFLRHWREAGATLHLVNVLHEAWVWLPRRSFAEVPQVLDSIRYLTLCGLPDELQLLEQLPQLVGLCMKEEIQLSGLKKLMDLDISLKVFASYGISFQEGSVDCFLELRDVLRMLSESRSARQLEKVVGLKIASTLLHGNPKKLPNLQQVCTVLPCEYLPYADAIVADMTACVKQFMTTEQEVLLRILINSSDSSYNDDVYWLRDPKVGDEIWDAERRVMVAHDLAVVMEVEVTEEKGVGWRQL